MDDSFKITHAIMCNVSNRIEIKANCIVAHTNLSGNPFGQIALQSETNTGYPGGRKSL